MGFVLCRAANGVSETPPLQLTRAKETTVSARGCYIEEIYMQYLSLSFKKLQNVAA